MFTLRRLFCGLALACFLVGNAAAGTLPHTLASHNLYTQTLKPISDSFQIAKSTFLPDSYDDLGLSGHENTKYNYNKGDQCAAYPLSSCPAGGSCIKCPFNRKKLKVTSCGTPYLLSGGTCVCPAAKPLTCTNDKCSKYCGSTCIEKSCSPTADQKNCSNGTQACDDGCCGTKRQCCVPCVNKITTKPANSSYTTSSCTDGSGSHQIQTGWTCDSGYHEKNGTCEKDCIVQNCSGYTLSSCPEHGICSSCTQTASNCSTNGTYHKLDSCESGYKISGNSCISLTCEEKGLKTCNGSCIATSACCGGCASGYSCKNGSCTPDVTFKVSQYVDIVGPRDVYISLQASQKTTRAYNVQVQIAGYIEDNEDGSGGEHYFRENPTLTFPAGKDYEAAIKVKLNDCCGQVRIDFPNTKVIRSW